MKHHYHNARIRLGRKRAGQRFRLDWLDLIFRNGVRHTFTWPRQPAGEYPRVLPQRVVGRKRVKLARFELTMTIPKQDITSWGDPTRVWMAQVARPVIVAEWEEARADSSLRA